VNQDPLKWLGLKPRDWQVSGNQIVSKGVGGYDPDSEEPGDTTDWDARCPDFPDHGSIEMWEYFKRLMNLERQEKYKITWKEAEADVAHITRSEGWETALTIYLMDHPEKSSKWTISGRNFQSTSSRSKEETSGRLRRNIGKRSPSSFNWIRLARSDGGIPP
jgi:hypothetical protein